MEFVDNYPCNAKINGGRCCQHSTKEEFERLNSTARTKASVRGTAKYFPLSKVCSRHFLGIPGLLSPLLVVVSTTYTHRTMESQILSLYFSSSAGLHLQL